MSGLGKFRKTGENFSVNSFWKTYKNKLSHRGWTHQTWIFRILWKKVLIIQWMRQCVFLNTQNSLFCSFLAGSVSEKPNCSAGDHLQCKRLGFDPRARKSPWRRKWQPTPVFLPGESLGQRSLAGYSPWGFKSRTRLSDLTTTTANHGIAFPTIMCLT